MSKVSGSPTNSERISRHRGSKKRLSLRTRWYLVLLLSLAPAVDYFDVYLQGNPLRGVGVQARVHDLVPPDNHDFHKKVGHLLGLLLGARHDQLVVGEVVLVTASRQLL